MNPLLTSTPVLSLIIPTRERADTLALTIATALQQKSQEFEIIISDNSSLDNTKDLVASFLDKRIRYFNTGKRVSMCDNYEFGLENSRGDYVIIIGDDDAVVAGGIDFLISLLTLSSDKRIHMWPLHTYDWPNNSHDGRLAYRAPIRPLSILDMKRKAASVVKKGGWKYYDLPSPYHAAVPKKLLDQIKSKTGRVFSSTQPDVFTAMALPALADYAINLGVSITFNGRSSRSNGLGFVNKSAKSNIDRFLSEYECYDFHDSLLIEAGKSANMIPDAVLKAYDFFPEVYSDTVFNYEAMWAFSCRHGFISYFEILKMIEKIRKKHKFKLHQFLFFSLIHEISAIRRKFLNLLYKKDSLNKNTKNILDLADEFGIDKIPNLVKKDFKSLYLLKISLISKN